MNNQCPHLTQHALSDIPRALAGEANGQAVLAALLGNDLKGIQLALVILCANMPAKKVVCFIHQYDDRTLTKSSPSCFAQQMTTDDVSYDFTSMVLIGYPAQADTKQSRIAVKQEA